MAALTLDSVLSEDFRFTFGFEVGLKNTLSTMISQASKTPV